VTTPNQARKSGRDAPRVYAWPPQPPHELEVISVTSALKGGLPKPFLVGWAAKTAAECAWDDFDVLTLLHEKKQQRAFIDHVKGARYRDMSEKADRGTIVHAAVEAYVAGTPLSKEDIEAKLEEARVLPAIRKAAIPMVSGVLAFLQDAEPEIVWSESTVYSRTYEYAGTADVIGRMNIGGSRVPVVIDFKTSKRIYDEVALQLTAYARADFVGLDDGTEVPLLPDGEVPQYGVVVRPSSTGKYESVTFALTDDVYRLYLACLTVARLDGVQAAARRPS